jgi:hypothetical protein
MTRDQYLDSVVSRMVDGLVEDFGDRALAQFRRKIDNPSQPLVQTDGAAEHPAPVPSDYTQPTVH